MHGQLKKVNPRLFDLESYTLSTRPHGTILLCSSSSPIIHLPHESTFPCHTLTDWYLNFFSVQKGLFYYYCSVDISYIILHNVEPSWNQFRRSVLPFCYTLEVSRCMVLILSSLRGAVSISVGIKPLAKHMENTCICYSSFLNNLPNVSAFNTQLSTTSRTAEWMWMCPTVEPGLSSCSIPNNNISSKQSRSLLLMLNQFLHVLFNPWGTHLISHLFRADLCPCIHVTGCL